MVICDDERWEAGPPDSPFFASVSLVLDDTAIAEVDDSFGVGGHLGLVRHQ